MKNKKDTRALAHRMLDDPTLLVEWVKTASHQDAVELKVELLAIAASTRFEAMLQKRKRPRGKRPRVYHKRSRAPDLI